MHLEHERSKYCSQNTAACNEALVRVLRADSLKAVIGNLDYQMYSTYTIPINVKGHLKPLKTFFRR